MCLFYPYSQFLKKKYGEKVYKLPINVPVTCPNRLNGLGCSFCAESGTGFEAMESHISITEQLDETKNRIREKYHANKYIAYFQNFTNTFLPLTTFEKNMQEAARADDVVEISVSTRPDCISKEYLDILAGVRSLYQKEITIELGLQTANYRTLEEIGRGHTLAEFIDAVLMIQPYGFDVCVHVILNLPKDDERDVLETAKILSALHIPIVKIHSLYVARNTVLCEAYENGTISICSKEEYLERVILFLEHLSPDMAVERLFSRIPKKDAVFSNWGVSWWKLKEELMSMMEERNTYQGSKFHYLNGAALSALNRDLE